MDKIRKEKFINYLFYNKYVAEFMFNDFYVELYNVLPKKICFSIENIKKENRVSNLKKATSILNDFLNNNVEYYNKLIEIYSSKNLEVLLKTF